MSRFLSYWATATLLALATVLVPSQASAGLCASCAGKSFAMNTGRCGGCAVTTASSAFTLCPACSAKNCRCEACGAALSAGKPVVAPVVPLDAGQAKQTTPVVPPPAVVPPLVLPMPEVRPVVPPPTVVPPVVLPLQEVRPVVPPVVPPPTATVPPSQPATGAPVAPAGK